MPGPQRHSHVVITAAVRDDGRFVAIASRPVFRSARDAGAYYRSSLAQQLIERGFPVEAGTGKHCRYFEIAGRPRAMLDAFSARSREVAEAAERFRAKWGRAPERGELRQLKRENRRRKVLVHRGDLDCAWQQTAAGFREARAEMPPSEELAPARALEGRGQQALAGQVATFAPREPAAVGLAQPGGELAPD